MEKKYGSKVDAWLLGVLYVVLFACLLPLFYDGALVVGVIAVVLLNVLVTAWLFSYRYIVSDTQLVVKVALLPPKRYDINAIRSIRRTRCPLSAPAASLDRLEIRIGNDTLLVSPLRKREFVDDLCQRSKNKIEVSI